MMRRTYTILYIIAALLFVACSTTDHLPAGEVLYTGQKKMVIEQPSNTKGASQCMDEVNAVLAKSPNNSFFGSSTMRFPIPTGLWMYNALYKYENQKGLGHWLFEHLAATPVLLTSVNPPIRTKIAANILHDYGYFNGAVKSELFYDKTDNKKVKVQYTVRMGTPAMVDTVYYSHFNKNMLSLMEERRKSSLVNPGDQFSVPALDEERTRITTLLRNRGYYYFRNDYLSYQADTVHQHGKISLKLQPTNGVPDYALRPYYLGNKSIYLMGKNGETPDQYTAYKDLDIYYYDKLQLRPKMLYRRMNYQAYTKNPQLLKLQQSRVYNQRRQSVILDRFSQIGIFKSVTAEYMPRDTAQLNDTLDVLVKAILNKPIEVELRANVTTKSNDQTGPGASLTYTNYNIFKGGETWTTKLTGSYEWQTANQSGGSLLNSWEFGINSGLTFPRILFPKLGKREYDFDASTTFNVNFDQLNRAKYYKLLSFGGNITYDFQPSRYYHHSITPIRLSFNVLQHTTAAFDSISSRTPALLVSLQNKFVPAFEYSLTYDNSSTKNKKTGHWWNIDFVSSGNITSVIYKAFGRSFTEKDKDLFGSPFAQFLKLSGEYRYTWVIDKNQSLVSRVNAGILYSYGNSTIAPYSEQFYAGGANSIRAFTVRSIGPGGYHLDGDLAKYAYVEETGDLKFIANTEFRFRMMGSIWGALFIDAGNVWLLRQDRNRPDSQINTKNLFKQIALGTGFGIRYDMDYLVFRLDIGVALHDPWDTGKSGYYNIQSFRKSLGIHFAIGYPF
jgi:outer membrane protein assembly factor BamA